MSTTLMVLIAGAADGAAAPQAWKARRAAEPGCCWALAAVAKASAAPAARIDDFAHGFSFPSFGKRSVWGDAGHLIRGMGSEAAADRVIPWSCRGENVERGADASSVRKEPLMAKISRFAYAQMFGPTTGDKVRLADTELFIEVEKDLTVYGEEVKFGGGKVIRDGMGQSQVTRARGRRGYGHHQRADRRRDRHLQGRYRPEGRPHRGDRQGRQSRHAARRHHHHRPRHRGDRRRRQDPDRRRHGRAYPLHLPAADRGGADVGRHHHARRRHRPGARHAGDHLHAGALASCPHDPGLRRLPDEHRPVGQGQRLAARPRWRRWCWPAPAR